MGTIIGIDLSLARTGLAVWYPGFTAPAMQSVSTRPDMLTEARHGQISGIIHSLLGDPLHPDGPRLAILEQVIDVPPRAEMVGLRAVVRYGLWRRGVHMVEVNLATLKTYATGNGRAGKDEMVLAAERRLGHLVTCANNDEADALWLLAMALHHYGRPLVELPKTHTRALAVPAWPAFSLDDTLAAAMQDGAP